MLEAIVWGLVQGLTEFLPISSSGHLVLVPAWLGLEAPDLGTSALLHLGTLAAVVIYYRADIALITRFRTNDEARHIVKLLAIGTFPAVAGVLAEDLIGGIQESVQLVAIALLVTAAILWTSGLFLGRTKTVGQSNARDALVIGLAQLCALIPGISRSGVTITAGLARSLSSTEAARFSFLLGIPAIAGAAIQQTISGAIVTGPTLIGMAVAAVSGYASIAFLIRIISRLGLRPFAWYAAAAGIYSLVVL